MPRKLRIYVPGVPAHVVQRGHNRQATFFTTQDYQYYLQILGQGCRRYGAQLHAYCLMTNHVHLLMTPQAADSISRVMQHLGRMYVRYVNKTYVRSGSLWEGRHKASLIHAEEYLLTCYRYIEMNPVAAGIVDSPAQYPWSSYRHHAYGEENMIIAEHELYRRLGMQAEQRLNTYQALFGRTLSRKTLQAIKSCLDYNYPLGNQRFQQQIEEILGRSIGRIRGGRPQRYTIVV